MDSCTLQNMHLKAFVKARGAEICSLQTMGGMDLLWEGNPSVWPLQTPHFFPVIGRLKGDVLRHQGRNYAMPVHGFAQNFDFKMVRLTREDCTLVLQDDEVTRAMYPFPFELRINIALEGPTLRVFYDVINRGPEPMPVTIGALPAFRWPLVPGTPRDQYRIKFELPESAPVRRLVDGLLVEQPQASPVEDRTLHPKDEYFKEGVLIFDQIRSKKVRYDAPGSPVLEIAWEGFQHIAVWTKPGSEFICIGPWRGLPSPVGFDGEFAQRPGNALIPAGGRRAFRYAVTVLGEP